MHMYTLNQIPSNAQIQKYLRKILFGKNIFCPVCRSREIQKAGERYWCKRCRRRFSLLSHTWLRGMKLSLEKFWLVLWCWTQKVPVLQAEKLCQLSEEAIRHWYDLFRAHLPENTVILERIVQLDEAYFKGRSLVMAKQKGTRKLAWEIIFQNSVERHHAMLFLQQYVKPRSKLHTDGAAIHKEIGRWWPVKHTRDIHKKFEFKHTSEIEGMFGNLRTFIRRMYHHTTPEKLPEYVSEFCCRFSLPELFENPKNYLEKSLSFAPFD
jgi:transposase-like protein